MEENNVITTKKRVPSVVHQERRIVNKWDYIYPRDVYKPNWQG